jgi:hypothetical protein
MRGRQWTAKLVSVGLAVSCVALGVVTSAGPASAATSTPACTFNGSAFPLIDNVTVGEKIAISCTGLPALRPYLLLQASLLVGIDPTAAALLSGGSLGPGTIASALAALPEIDAASFAFPVSDLNGDLSYTYTVPTIQPLDPNATCPPTTQEINSGLIGCALAMVDLTTQKPLSAGSAVLQYKGEPLFPPGPTLALSAATAKRGTQITVSDAPGATTYWWLATLIELEGLLGGTVTPATISVDFVRRYNSVAAANTVTVTPASYNGTTLTPPSISGSVTVPPRASGKYEVVVLYIGDLEGIHLGISSQTSIKV